MHVNDSQRKHEAWLSYRDQRYPEAMLLYRQHLKDHPEDGQAMAMVALCFAGMQRFAPVRLIAKQALENAPTEPMAHYAMAIGVLYAPSLIGSIWTPQAAPWLTTEPASSHERIHQAEKHLEEAIKLDPNRASFRGQLALFRYLRRDFTGALQAANEGLLLDIEEPLCLEATARSQFAMSEQLPSLRTAQRMLEAEEDNPTAHAIAARAMLSRHDIDDAIDHAEQAVTLSPYDPECFDVLLDTARTLRPGWKKPIGFALWSHRYRHRWTARRLLFIAIILAVGAGLLGMLAATFTNEPNTAMWIHLSAWAGVTAFAGLLFAPVGLAGFFLSSTPRLAHVVPPQRKVEAALVISSLLYLAAALPAWYFQRGFHEHAGTFIAALACFVPALAALVTAAPGNDRRQMLMGLGLTAFCWAIAAAAVIYADWSMAPICFFLPACVALGMSAWVANRGIIRHTEEV